MSPIATYANVILAVGVLIGYVVLTALNHDATSLLVLLGGQGAAVGTAHSAEALKNTKAI